jgi:hypothetical protein
MNELHTLHQSLTQELPAAAVLKLDPPAGSHQTGWLDIKCFGKWIAVEWKPGTGFGVSSLNRAGDPAQGLFDGPDEVFEHWSDAQSHILSLLTVESKPRLVARA